jgi:predicted amidohydrolase
MTPLAFRMRENRTSGRCVGVTGIPTTTVLRSKKLKVMKVNVATVQMISNNNDYDGNRLRAEKYIADAINQDAKLILLPEFALAGYVYTDEFWNMAEPLKGRTCKWQKGLSERYGLFISLSASIFFRQ